MKQDFLSRIPLINVESLDGDHEIRIEYDANGNPVRIRKVRQNYGWIVWLVGLILALLLFYRPMRGTVGKQ